MNDLLNTLLGLDAPGFGDAGVHFGWARPLPGWAWGAAILLGVAIAWWSYRRLPGRVWMRVALGSLRALVILLLALLFAGPRLEKPNNRTERDLVVFLLDRSASMAIADAPSPAGVRTSRDDQLRGAVADATEALVTLGEDKDTLWLGFAGSAWSLDGAGSALPEIGEPDGRSTALSGALDAALERAAARPISGVVLLSDGRSTPPPDPDTLGRLQAASAPVYAVALGSAEPIADIAIARVDAPRRAFPDDTIPVRVELTTHGGNRRPLAGAIELVDPASGRVLDTLPLGSAEPDPSGRSRYTLSTRLADAGVRTLLVRVRTNTADLIDANNQHRVGVEVIDRPLRVLYLDGSPRWEHRYLKNMLLREEGIISTNLLLAPDRHFTQESDEAITGVPGSPGQWDGFDAIVIGDLRADLLGSAQLEQLREHVADSGAGLLWIAGPSATPGSWAGTPMGDLLPVRAGTGLLSPWTEDTVLVRTPEADRLGVLALGEGTDGWPAQIADPASGWSRLRWVQRIEPNTVKPAAVALANAHPASAPDDPALARPGVLFMRYGSGRIAYVATDETWRWRYGRGEELQERFWLPMIRMLARGRLGSAGLAAHIETSTDQPSVGQLVRVSLDIHDEALTGLLGPSATLDATDERGNATPIELMRTSGDGASYEGVWAPTEPGQVTLSTTDPALSGLGISAGVRVIPPDDERRTPQSDHAALAKLAEQTGGKIVAPEDLGTLPDLLPNRSVVVAGRPDIQTLWDRPAVLALLIVLLTVEWLGRKALRLA